MHGSWVRLFEQGEPFLESKESLLLAVDGHRDDDLVEELHRALDHVEVAVGDGIKTAGVDGASHREQPDFTMENSLATSSQLSVSSSKQNENPPI